MPVEQEFIFAIGVDTAIDIDQCRQRHAGTMLQGINYLCTGTDLMYRWQMLETVVERAAGFTVEFAEVIPACIDRCKMLAGQQMCQCNQICSYAVQQIQAERLLANRKTCM